MSAGEPEERLHAQVLREAPPETDEALLARGARLAERLNRARDGAPLEVCFVDIGCNAFALPGRRVYAGRGLFAMSDALLAFVVAHEMAHHDLGHYAAPPAAGADPLREVVIAASRTAADETAADRAALELVRRAGFAESGARAAFDLLADVERQDRVDMRPETEQRAVELAVARLGIARPFAPAAARRRALWGLAAAARTTPASRGFAATGATVACAECAVRFAPLAACPRCGGTELYPLTDPASRSRFLAVRRVRGAMGGALVVLASLALASLWIPGAPRLALAVLAVGAWTVAALISRAFSPMRLRPARPRLARGAAEVTVAGRVLVTRAATSPLGTRCAAWRLTGSGPGGRIDDAGAGQFDVVAAERVIARVAADDALIDLGPAGARAVHRAAGPLAAFLAARGRAGDGARVRLAETVLLDGDGVEVRGVADEVVVVEGYRDATPVPLFRDWPAIRKI